MRKYVLKANLRNGKELYLKEVKNEYPFKTADINEAQGFSTKAKAWATFRTINPIHICWESWNLVQR